MVFVDVLLCSCCTGVMCLIYFVFLLLFTSWLFSYVFFFFKQKTAYEMRISDWSSDVCSSDLLGRAMATLFQKEPAMQARREMKRFKMLMETGELANPAN